MHPASSSTLHIRRFQHAHFHSLKITRNVPAIRILLRPYDHSAAALVLLVLHGYDPRTEAVAGRSYPDARLDAADHEATQRLQMDNRRPQANQDKIEAIIKIEPLSDSATFTGWIPDLAHSCMVDGSAQTKPRQRIEKERGGKITPMRLPLVYIAALNFSASQCLL